MDGSNPSIYIDENCLQFHFILPFPYIQLQAELSRYKPSPNKLKKGLVQKEDIDRFISSIQALKIKDIGSSTDVPDITLVPSEPFSSYSYILRDTSFLSLKYLEQIIKLNPLLTEDVISIANNPVTEFFSCNSKKNTAFLIRNKDTKLSSCFKINAYLFSKLIDILTNKKQDTNLHIYNGLLGTKELVVIEGYFEGLSITLYAEPIKEQLVIQDFSNYYNMLDWVAIEEKDLILDEVTNLWRFRDTNFRFPYTPIKELYETIQMDKQGKGFLLKYKDTLVEAYLFTTGCVQ